MSTIIAQLKCEYQTDPIGMDAVAPRFSWIFQSDLRDIEQTAYQILVADQLELLQKDQGNCWDSGMVNSKESIQQSYRGIPLVSRQRYYWKVRALLKDVTGLNRGKIICQKIRNLLAPSTMAASSNSRLMPLTNPVYRKIAIGKEIAT